MEKGLRFGSMWMEREGKECGVVKCVVAVCCREGIVGFCCC